MATMLRLFFSYSVCDVTSLPLVFALTIYRTKLSISFHCSSVSNTLPMMFSSVMSPITSIAFDIYVVSTLEIQTRWTLQYPYFHTGHASDTTKWRRRRYTWKHTTTQDLRQIEVYVAMFSSNYGLRSVISLFVLGAVPSTSSHCSTMSFLHCDCSTSTLFNGRCIFDCYVSKLTGLKWKPSFRAETISDKLHLVSEKILWYRQKKEEPLRGGWV